MAGAQTDLVLYASFLQNRQQEKSNKNFRLIKDLIEKKGDASALTKNLELSLSELKEAQLASLKDLWDQTSYPTLQISDHIRYHAMYSEEMQELENRRILANCLYLQDQKTLAGPDHADVTAESLGLSNSRRPIKRLPPTHVTKESGANFGVDPSDGSSKGAPLLYPKLITDLKEVNDVLIFLPATTIVDFQPSVRNIIIRGRELGFGERHFDSCLKIFVNRYFPQYASVFLNGVTASQTFEHILTVFRSHDIISTLKNTLRHFCRESQQSFTEFGTILNELATRVVSETHLQMSAQESKEFAEDKLLTFLTTFTSDQVRKLFDTERATALRSNSDFYSFNGAVIEIYKIETFVKPPAIKYMVPTELYNALTNDTSLTSNVMLQAMSILNIKNEGAQPSITESNNPQFFATGFQPYNKKAPDDHRSNPRWTSPGQRPRTPSRDRNSKPSDKKSWEPRERSKNRNQFDRRGKSPEGNQYDNKRGRSPAPNQYGGRQRSNSQSDRRPRSFSNSRGDRYEKAPPRQPTPDRQQARGNGRQPFVPRGDLRGRSRSQDGNRTRGQSRDRAPTPQPGRNGSRGRQQPFQRQENTPRTRSNSQGRSGNFIERRGRSQDRNGAAGRPSRSPSRPNEPRFCPYCGGSSCGMAQCTVFDKTELSHWGCELCTTKLLHRTSAHNKLS
jgi:hypothetical protein